MYVKEDVNHCNKNAISIRHKPFETNLLSYCEIFVKKKCFQKEQVKHRIIIIIMTML